MTAKDFGPGPGVMYMTLDPSGEIFGSLTAGLAPNAAASSANVRVDCACTAALITAKLAAPKIQNFTITDPHPERPAPLQFARSIFENKGMAWRRRKPLLVAPQ